VQIVTLAALFAVACHADALSDRSAGKPAAAHTSEAVTRRDGALFAIPTTVDHAGRILARVVVNGQGPFRFMVDTGANQTALSAALVAHLHLALDQNQPVQVTGIAGSARAPTVYISSVEAGALKLRGARLPVLAGPVLADIDGILGIDSLTNKTLDADFIHDRLAIHGSIGGVPIGDMVFPARLIARHLLEIDVVVGGVPTKAIVDTGSPRTLGNEALLSALQHKFQLETRGVATGLVDATETAQAATLEPVASLHLGDVTIANLFVTFGDFAVFRRWDLNQRPALLLGMDVLGEFAEMSIDYRRRELGLLAKPDVTLAR
jgi:predicted aspartyl protease